MDDYTLNLFKLKHINIDLEKSEIIYNDDEPFQRDAWWV